MAASLFSDLIDFIFPLECLACGREGSYCCAGCLARVRLLEKGLPDCRPFERVFAAASYGEPIIRRSLADWKLEGLSVARGPIESVVRRWHDRFGASLPDGLVIVPVPLHPLKLRDRGFNQAAEIAGLLAGLGGSSVVEALKRLKRTAPQFEAEDRPANVAGVFGLCPGASMRGRDVLLVDDIWTSGSTMGECAKVLKAAGTARLFGFTAAAAFKRRVAPDIHAAALPTFIRARNRLRSWLGFDPTETL